MGKKTATYFSLVRVAWMALALMVLLLCGPLKRLVELDAAASVALTSHSHTFKKHKSASYERRNVPPKSFYAVTGYHAGNDLVLFPGSLLSFLVPFLKRDGASQPQFLSTIPFTTIPLYLHHHRWQV